MANIKALMKIAEATPLSDSLGTMLWSPLYPVTAIGATAGLLSDDLKKHRDSKLKALLPGVGAYRIGERLSSQVKHEQEDADKKNRKDVRPVAHAMSEGFGPITSTAAAALAGLVAGGATTGRHSGAMAGAGLGAAGAIAANLIGAIAAAIKRRRTKEEQMKSDEKSVLLKYLIPGLATYDSYKRLGRSQGDRDEAE